MVVDWTFAKIQDYITNQVEENLNLDYKAADALGKDNSKTIEIFKDFATIK